MHNPELFDVNLNDLVGSGTVMMLHLNAQYLRNKLKMLEIFLQSNNLI